MGLPLALDQPTEKWFPVSNSAREVRDRLLEAAQRAGCHIAYGKRIQDVSTAQGAWHCTCADGSTHSASRLVCHCQCKHLLFHPYNLLVNA